MLFGRLSERYRSSTLRLSSFYALLFGFAIIGLGMLTNLIVTDRLRYGIQSLAQSQFSLVVDTRRGNARHIATSLANREMPRLSYMLFNGETGEALAGDFSLAMPVPKETFHEAKVYRADIGNQENMRRTFLGYGGPLADGSILFIGEDTEHMDRFSAELLRAFGIAGAGMFVLAVIGGAILSRGILNKINLINRTLVAVAGGNLKARTGAGQYPPTWAGDEFDQLARNVDDTLERVGALMDEVRHVTDDIAHDLKTPLSRLRQKLESAGAHACSREEFQRVSEDAIERINAILETFQALLSIAQVEGGKQSEQFAEFDLGEIARAVHEAYQPVAEEEGRTLLLLPMGGGTIMGDRRLTLQAVANLVENALRHTPPGTPVTLTVAVIDDRPTLTVLDRGPGIPAEDRPKVLRRFYRLDQSRTTPGNGLGLAMVAAIARAHGATLTLNDGHPGLKATLQFPRPDAKRRTAASEAGKALVTQDA